MLEGQYVTHTTSIVYSYTKECPMHQMQDPRVHYHEQQFILFDIQRSCKFIWILGHSIISIDSSVTKRRKPSKHHTIQWINHLANATPPLPMQKTRHRVRTDVFQVEELTKNNKGKEHRQGQ